MSVQANLRMPWGTIPEAAEALRVTPRTVRNMIARGDLEARRFGPRLIRVNLETMADRARPLGGVH